MNKILIAGLVALPIALMADMDRCVACHGVDFEKKALGVSKIVKNMSEAEIKASLDGYMVGKGGSMKEVMIKEVKVGVDTDAMAADVYNEIITPGFEEPDAEFIFKKRRTVRGLHKIKMALKKAKSKSDNKKAIAQIKSFAFDIYNYDASLRKSVDIDSITKKQMKSSDILEVVTKAKSCTDHSFSEDALLKCRVSFLNLATTISLNDAAKLQKKIKPKAKHGSSVGIPKTAHEATKAIVGTWIQSCHSIKPKVWATKEVKVKSDMSASGGMQFFSDAKCTHKTKEIKRSYTFKFGDIVLGDDGKEAWQVDKVIGKKKKKIYAMIRFLDADRVVVSAETKERKGLTPESRKNHFDAKWEGCVRKK